LKEIAPVIHRGVGAKRIDKSDPNASQSTATTARVPSLALSMTVCRHSKNSTRQTDYDDKQVASDESWRIDGN
jgi:hypothetical protein